MTFRDRETLLTRVRQLRRRAAVQKPSPDAGAPADRGRIEHLEARIEHLERLVEGLQDSVHRESARHAKLIAELQAQVQPATMGAALSEDARARGL